MQKLIFDVNGTLTPPNEKIDLEFKRFMLDLSANIDCYIVTMSSDAKILEQLGCDLYNSFVLKYTSIKDKSQILKDFDIGNDDIYFFGDSIFPDGNDFELAIELGIYINKIYPVRDWMYTMNLLKELKDM